MIVFEYAYTDGMSVGEARRLNDQEKIGVSDWFKTLGMIGIGEQIKLPYLSWNDPLVSDLLKRPEDGQFFGCSNTVRIITPEEKEQLIVLDRQKKDERERKERETEIAWLRDRLSTLRHGKLYTREGAELARKQWNDLQNEGGEGFVPHFATYEEYEEMAKRLAELEGVN